MWSASLVGILAQKKRNDNSSENLPLHSPPRSPFCPLVIFHISTDQRNFNQKGTDGDEVERFMNKDLQKFNFIYVYPILWE